MLNKNFFAKIGFIAAVAGASLIPTVAKAADTEELMLDWDTAGWQNHTQASSGFNRSISVGQGSLDFEFILDEGTEFSSHNSDLTPQVNGVLNGTQADSGEDEDKSLHLQIDPDKRGNGVTMKTSFTDFFGGSVSDVSFNLFDIDISSSLKENEGITNNSWQDLVQVRGFLNGEVVNAVFDVLNPNKVLADGDTLTGVKSTNNEQDGGNVTVSFASEIDSFELFFADGDGKNDAGEGNVKSNPSNHGIGIGDISFTASTKAVPEPTTIFGLLAFGAFGAHSARKRKQQ